MERKRASEFPQELLDLFHEYQHGEITRRDFFDRAAKFAVGGLTVTAIWESLRPNYAWAQQVPKDDMRITPSYETVPSPEGNGSIKGYLARPAHVDRQAAGRARHPREPRDSIPTSRMWRAGWRSWTSSPSRRTASRRSAGIRATTRRRRRRSGPWTGEDGRGLRRLGEVAEGAPGVERQARRRRLLLRRRDREPARGAAARDSTPACRSTAASRARTTCRRSRRRSCFTTPATIRASTPGSRPSRRRSRPTGRPTTLYVYEGTQHGFHNDTTPALRRAGREARVAAHGRLLQPDASLAPPRRSIGGELLRNGAATSACVRTWLVAAPRR